MNLLDSLARFYGEGFLNRFLLLIVFWIIWPGLMFVVGIIGESREVPLIKRQSRAFFPGDLSIGLILVALISMYAKTGTTDIPMLTSPYWWLPLIVVVVVAGWRWRKGDVANYPERARRSPTKISHDIIGYFIAPIILIGLGIPQICMLDTEGVFTATRLGWLVVAMSLVLYLFCVALDIINYADLSDIYARHPDDWAPIWRTRHRK